MPPLDPIVASAFILTGILLLWFGADWLVGGSVRIAERFGVSPLVIGLTVVAFGTSMPEMAVSVAAALRGNADIAIANVVGSNIFNVLIILGLSAVIVPLPAHTSIIRRETPIMIAASLLCLFFARDLRFERWEGIVLFCGIVVYTIATVFFSRRNADAVSTVIVTDPPTAKPPLGRAILLVAIGLIALIGGSEALVRGAVSVAERFQVPASVIGVTIVAAGTSLPELATSCMAAIRRQPDIAVGNIVGSNVFNIFSILGAASIMKPLTVENEMLRVDLPIMVFVAIVVWPIVATGKRVSRVEGMLLLAGYVAYGWYLVAYRCAGVI